MVMSKFARKWANRTVGYQSVMPLYSLGGINQDENPRVLRPTDLVVGYNCARKGSMLGTRPGVKYGDTDFSAALSGTPAVQGVFSLSYDRGTENDLVVIAGGAVYTDDTPTTLNLATNSVSITAGADNLWTFADFQDKLFAAGGADTDDVWYWDGSADPDKIAFPAGFDPKYIFEKWNFLFVGGMTVPSGSPTFDDNSMVARYCNYAQDATDVTNWPSANIIPGQLLDENFGVGSYGSEYNTGFGEFQGKGSDLLLFLTNKRIMAYRPNENATGSSDAFRLDATIPIGCVSQHSFVNLGADSGDAVFISRDGIHSLAQSRTHGEDTRQYLSWPIRRFWQTVNIDELDKAFGVYWPQEGMVVFAVPTGSNTTNDTLLCLDIKGAQALTPESVRWYIWELNGITANTLSLCRRSDGVPYVYVGGTAGEVVRFDRDVYSDLETGSVGNAINCIIQTANSDMGVPSRSKQWGDLFVMFQGSGNHTVQYIQIQDDGETSGQSSILEVPVSLSTWGTGTWGTAVWGTNDSVKRHRVPNTGASVTVGHRFAHSGAGEPYWVGLIDQLVFVSGATLDAEANTVGS